MKVKDLLKDVENVELTPEQEKQIKDYLGIKESKRWKPKKHDEYWFIMDDGIITDSRFDNTFSVCNGHLYMNNCFKTKEEAKFALKKCKVYLELKNFADENNDPIDWTDPISDKYFILLDYEKGILRSSHNCWMETLGTIYFSSQELAMKAIKTVGEDRIKKYLFGVE